MILSWLWLLTRHYVHGRFLRLAYRLHPAIMEDCLQRACAEEGLNLATVRSQFIADGIIPEGSPDPWTDARS